VDETTLRGLLDSALVDEPPIGPVAENALRAGIKRRRRRRALGVVGSAAVVAVLIAGSGALSHALFRPKAPGATRSAVTSAPAEIQNAVAWVAAQASRSAVVSCDPQVCADLANKGFPSANLSTLGPESADPLVSDLVVATADIRARYGDRLASAYAPVIIASFGSGDRRIDIRAIAPHGAAAYLSALRADVTARKSAGITLVHSRQITTSAAARAQLIEGKVDRRLLSTIADLAAIHPVSILAFGDSGPGASPGMPLRAADLAEAVGHAARPSPAYVQSMVNFLHAQHGTRAPAHIQTVRLTGGRAALRVEFAAPSPVGR
jgi:hypothetical protein